MGEYLKLLSMLKLEFYFGIICFVFFMKATPLDVLVQDKICKLKYNMGDDFCRELSSIEEDDDNYKYKSQILSEAVTFKSYQNLIYYIPGTIWSLFLGSWCDRYAHAKKWILIIGGITTAIECLMNALNSYYFSLNLYWILASFVPYTLSGAMAISTCYTYVAATSPNKYKAIRITILEILLMFSQPVSNILTGQLIDTSYWVSNGALHNTGLLFAISSALSFVTFLWTIFMINEEGDRKQFEIKFNEKVAKNSGYSESKHPLKLLFDLKNVKLMIMTFIKKRPYNVRAQILLLCVALFNYMFLMYAPFTFLFQFTERLYNWDAQTYSNISSIGLFINSLVALILGPILIKKFNLNDMMVSIIGFIGVYNLSLFRGVLLKPLGFYLSMATSCTFTLSSVGFKSHLSKIVDQSEVGKVFTIIMVLDSLAPILASSLMAMLFEATIDTAPGTCFIILAFLALVTIFIAYAIDFIYLKNEKIKQSHNTELNNNITSIKPQL